MEVVFRLHMPLCDGEFLSRVIVRSIVVIGFIILLGASARNYGEFYRAALEEDIVSKAGVRADTIRGERLKEAVVTDTGNVSCVPDRKAAANIAGRIDGMNLSSKVNYVRNSLYEQESAELPAADGEVSVETICTDGKVSEDENSPAALKVILYGNGGIPKMAEFTCDRTAFSLEELAKPEMEKMIFDGWYVDEGCKIPFETTEGLEKDVLVLYAGWRKSLENLEDEKGFILDDRGCIIGCGVRPDTVVDGLLCVPAYEECTGIEKGAFDAVKDLVTDIYISGNISYIAPGAFDNLEHLMYIEVFPENLFYYSDNGIVYNMDGTEAACPAPRRSK